MGIAWEDVKLLRNSPVFNEIPVHERDELLDELNARVRVLEKGRMLCRAGESLDFFPVVLEGRVQASMPQGGCDREVSTFGPGESFAEAVPHTLKHSPVNIRALERTRLLCIPASGLDKSSNPYVYVLRENLSNEMSKKIGKLTQTLSVVGEPRLRDRVLAHLRTLPTDSQGWMEIQHSRSAWAAYLRVAEKSLIRELSALQQEGVIEVDGHRIRFL